MRAVKRVHSPLKLLTSAERDTFQLLCERTFCSMPGLCAGTQLRMNKPPATGHTGRVQPGLQVVGPLRNAAAAHCPAGAAPSPQQVKPHSPSAFNTTANIPTAPSAAYRRHRSSTTRLSPQPGRDTACAAPWHQSTPASCLPHSAQQQQQCFHAIVSSSSSRKLRGTRQQHAAAQQLPVLPLKATFLRKRRTASTRAPRLQQKAVCWSSSWPSRNQPVVAAAVAAAAGSPSDDMPFHQQQQLQDANDANNICVRTVHASSSDGHHSTTSRTSLSHHVPTAAANASSAVLAWERNSKALRLQPVRLPSRRRSTSSLVVAPQQQQQQQQAQQELTKLKQLCEHPRQWMQHRHQKDWQPVQHPCHQQQIRIHLQPALQQQQQHLPPELKRQPARDQPVLLNISSLWQQFVSDAEELKRLNFQHRRQQSRQRWRQKQSELLDHHHEQVVVAAEQPQQLLWVTVHQPGGPGTAAALWVGRTFLQLEMQQLHLFGEGKQQQTYAKLPRPDLGLEPAAVVHGYTFEQGLGVWSRSGDTWNARSASSNTAHLRAQQHSQDCAEAAAAGISTAAAAVHAFDIAGDTAAAGAAATEIIPGTANAVQNSNSCSSSSSSSSNTGWFDFLLLVDGDFSVREHENMFPNALHHCGDGRVKYQARGAHDVAEFVAEAQESAIQEHMKHSIRLAWDRRDPAGNRQALDPSWVLQRLQQRWGLPAMVRFGVDMMYFSKIFRECHIVGLPAHDDVVTAASK